MKQDKVFVRNFNCSVISVLVVRCSHRHFLSASPPQQTLFPELNFTSALVFCLLLFGFSVNCSVCLILLILLIQTTRPRDSTQSSLLTFFNITKAFLREKDMNEPKMSKIKYSVSTKCRQELKLNQDVSNVLCLKIDSFSMEVLH